MNLWGQFWNARVTNIMRDPSEFLELGILVFSPFKEELLDVKSEALECFHFER